MKTNVAACSSIGSYFYPQIALIYHDMLSMYRATSGMISDSVVRDGALGISWKPLVLESLTGFRSNCYKDAKSPWASDD